jgi:hypothetical protein
MAIVVETLDEKLPFGAHVGGVTAELFTDPATRAQLGEAHLPEACRRSP